MTQEQFDKADWLFRDISSLKRHWMLIEHETNIGRIADYVSDLGFNVEIPSIDEIKKSIKEQIDTKIAEFNKQIAGL